MIMETKEKIKEELSALAQLGIIGLMIFGGYKGCSYLHNESEKSYERKRTELIRTLEEKAQGVVMYHGTIEELNAKNVEDRYTEADVNYVISINRDIEISQALAKSDLREKGYDGLVHYSITGGNRIGRGGTSPYLLQGTPIKKIKGERK